MAQDLRLIQDLAVVLVAAGVAALAFHKLRLPTVLGYLAAGVVVGPHVAPGLVQDSHDIDVLAQLGILFLLFGLGLDFHLGKLRKVGGLALTAGTLETALLVGVGIVVGRMFGWRGTDALFLGAILAISSTTLIAKVLGELGKLEGPVGEAILGILLVEDVIAVVLIALLSSLALTGTVSLVEVALVLARVAIFVLATLVIGLIVVPRLVDHVATLRVEALLVVVAVGVAFAAGMIAVALGLSLALGAFVAGAIVAESRASAAVEHRVAPLRDVFAAVFFVSVGILLDPADIIRYWPAIAILGVVSILGKIAAVSVATFVAGYPPARAMKVGIGMAMIGEFSFVLATLGSDLGVTSGFLLPIAVCVSALTTLVTPPLVRHSDALVARLGRAAPRSVVEYVDVYSAWSARRGERSAYRGLEARALLRVLAFSALLVALAVLGRAADALVSLVVPNVWAEIAVIATFALASIPIVIGLGRAVRRFVSHMTGGPIVRRTFYAFLALLLGAVAFAAGAAFLPPLPLVGGALVIVLAAGLLFRRTLQKLRRQLDQAVDTILQGDAQAPGTRDEVLALIRERAPWDLHVQSVIVSPGSRAIGRRVRDLQLPQRTGATIVTHERDGRIVLNPPPTTIIEAGDTVGVMGEKEQVAQARQLLSESGANVARPEGLATEGVAIEELEIAHGSPLAGLTLAGSRLRETTGASVVGVRRDGVPILNPAPVLRLQPGDAVVLLGTQSQVEAARSLFLST